MGDRAADRRGTEHRAEVERRGQVVDPRGADRRVGGGGVAIGKAERQHRGSDAGLVEALAQGAGGDAAAAVEDDLQVGVAQVGDLLDQVKVGIGERARPYEGGDAEAHFLSSPPRLRNDGGPGADPRRPNLNAG
jgi:hypothetical protein